MKVKIFNTIIFVGSLFAGFSHYINTVIGMSVGLSTQKDNYNLFCLRRFELVLVSNQGVLFFLIFVHAFINALTVNEMAWRKHAINSMFLS